ncbi:MAG TPA: SH3 domain-containing protein [Candidatus Sericytochromatia bacterium]
MKKMNQLGKLVSVLAVIAIAFTGMSTPVMAGTDITSSKESLQLAQASLVGQCRAAKLSIPIFRERVATSEALRLLSANQTVTLSDNAVDANGFIGISAPTPGFVHAINLKPCGTPPPPTGSLCRRVVQPPDGLVIRRDPSSTSPSVGGVAYLGQVTLTTNPPTVRRGENRDWVQISAPASGWVSNGFTSATSSNLAFCQ